MDAKDRFIVLSAEDDPDDQLLIKDAIKAISPSLVLQFVENGKELLDHLHNAKTNSHGLPSMVLLDLNMPLIDGREALRKIKKENSFQDLPIVVLTTSTEEKDKQHCIKLGAADFICKPPSFGELVEGLQGVFSKWLPTEL